MLGLSLNLNKDDLEIECLPVGRTVSYPSQSFAQLHNW